MVCVPDYYVRSRTYARIAAASGHPSGMTRFCFLAKFVASQGPNPALKTMPRPGQTGALLGKVSRIVLLRRGPGHGGQFNRFYKGLPCGIGWLSAFLMSAHIFHQKSSPHHQKPKPLHLNFASQHRPCRLPAAPPLESALDQKRR